ncbi:MAG: 2-oxoacid:acceptor oxidoreductase family protein [bacterium]|nr:2-oxoacid:acceptor oxidoreductase family protein [bacterium]
MPEKQTLEIRWHGRGGQGIVTAAKMPAEVIIKQNGHALASQEYGPERSGAPIKCYTTISNTEIKMYSQPEHPDIVIVVDSTLLKTEPILEGTNENAIIIVNSSHEPENIARAISGGKRKVWTVDATAIALQELGKNFPNTTLLGALIRATELVSLENILEKVAEGLGKKNAALLEGNLQAVRRGYNEARFYQGSEDAVPSTPAPPQKAWYEIEEAGTLPAGTAKKYSTGDWRITHPVLNEQCVHCMLCWLFCPDNAIVVKNEKVIGFDPEHCKGCGICAEVCPPKIRAIAMEEGGEPCEK